MARPATGYDPSYYSSVDQFAIGEQNKRARGQAKTTSVVQDKKQPKKVASALSGMSLTGASPATGPKSLDASRDAWAQALQSMSGVNTPDPISAGAKVLGMGLAGYGTGKATRDKEAGTAEYRKRLADALSGTPDNASLMQLAFDPYADEGAQRMLWNMWERSNPTEEQRLARQKLQMEIDKMDDPRYIGTERGTDGRMYRIPEDPLNPAVPIDNFTPYQEPEKPGWKLERGADGNMVYVPDRPGFEPRPYEGPALHQDPQKPNIVTVKIDKNREVQFDLSNPDHKKRYDAMVEEMQRIGLTPPSAPEPNVGLFETPKDAASFRESQTKLLESMNPVQQLREALPALQTMGATINSDSGPNDMNFIYGFAKIMDPIGSVKEGEQRAIAALDTLAQQIGAEAMNVYRRQGKLSPELKQQLYEQARQKVSAIRQNAVGARQSVAEQGRMMQLDPEAYLPQLGPMPGPHVPYDPLRSMTTQRLGAGPPAARSEQPATPVPGPAPARPAPPQGLQLPPEKAQMLPPGLWEQVQREAAASQDPQATLQTFIQLLDDPSFLSKLGQTYPQFFQPPGGGGGGW